MLRPFTVNGVPVPYQASIASLRKQLRAAKPEAWAAFVALSANPTAEALEILVKEANSPDPYYRRAAIDAIAGHELGAKAALVIQCCLGDSNGYVVRAACAAAANLNLHQLSEVLIDLKSVATPATRRAAIEALGSLWRTTLFDQMLSQLGRDSSLEVRKAILSVLNANVDEYHWKTLFDVLRKDLIPRHRVWACDLAARFGGTDEIRILKRLRRDPDGHVRKAAERALGRLSP